MPSNSVDFRANCGCFYWTFLNFMRKRADKKKAMRIRVIRGLSAPLAMLTVFIVGFLLRCGDIEANPGPPKHSKQSTLTQASVDSPAREKRDSVSESKLDDVLKMLSALDKKVDSIQSMMEKRCDKLEKDVATVVKENTDLKKKVDRLEAKVDDLEGRSRRNNLIFYGIPTPNGQESWEQCEATVKNVLKKEMGIREEIEMERVHRLKGNKSPSAVIVAFQKFKDKERVLAARKQLKERKSNIFVTEDYSPRVREQRRNLLPFMREARDARKKAFLRFDSLSIDGKSFVYDAATDGLVERGRQN